MATIMTERHSGDSHSRRCDATCHNAKPGTKCNCICGGRYHAKGGSQQAQEQLTRDWLGDDWRETKAAIEAQGGSLEVALVGALLEGGA